MKIFIRGNGTAFDKRDLMSFIGEGLHDSWCEGFHKHGQIVSCRILRVMDVAGACLECHGLIEVRPDLRGWQVIRQLDGRIRDGEVVQVRQWFDRDHRRDRRSTAIVTPHPRNRDQRSKVERRRMVRVQLLHDLPKAM